MEQDGKSHPVPSCPSCPQLKEHYGACTSPAPTRATGNGRCFAVAISFLHNTIPRNVVDVSAHNAAHPATCGVAMLVPLLMPKRVGRGTDENTSRPGPEISTFPKFENADGVRVASSDATDMIVGEFAGDPVFDAALPDAATIRLPLLSAAAPAAV